MESPDAIILGGGIIGLTAALELADAGLRVSVYDRGQFGQEASWAGAGILPPWGPGPKATPLDELRAISVSRFAEYIPQLQRQTQIDSGYRVCGGFEFVSTPDREVIAHWELEQITFDKNAKFSQKHKGTCCWLPGLAQIRNPRFLKALIQSCRQRGVSLDPNNGFENWIFNDHDVTGIRLSDGNITTANRYIIATGAWSEQLLKPLGVALGIHPVRGQMALLRGDAGKNMPIIIDGKMYIVPRGDGLILAGSTEEPDANFEKGNTRQSIEKLVAFAQINASCWMDSPPVLERTWSGLRPGSADGYPTIGRVPAHDNILAAVGHFRAGIQLSLGTATLLKQLMLAEPTTINPLPFAFGRPDMSGILPAFRS